MTDDILPWLAHYVEFGAIKGLASDPSNYMPAYNYLLALAAPLTKWLQPVIVIKLISVSFVPVAAWLTYRIVTHYRGHRRGLLAACLFPLIPTVFLNAAYWGLPDLIYSTFLLATFCGLIHQRPGLAMAMFGMALSIKLQAVFLSPFLAYLFLQGRIRWAQIPIVPAVFLASLLPAALAGRPWSELLNIYTGQATIFKQLSMSAPNIYQILQRFDLVSYETGVAVGIAVAALVGVALVATPYFLQTRRVCFELELALLSLFVIPYVLPKMHDRYFFPADIFSVVLAVVWPRYWPIALGIQMASTMAYSNYLFAYPMASHGAVVMTLTLCLYL
ncbi:MAG: hypothetical protein WBA91_07565, partial [Paracoccaceae bacterium]